MTRRTGKRALMALSMVVLALPALSLPVSAQEGEAAAMPEGWMVRLDRAGGSAPSFVAMPPGWHITTGPAAIFYDPATTASGTFRVESEVFQFDPGSRNEAYGVFIGGKDLDGDGQSYLYFLIRRDGSYLVKRRDGSETANVQGWTSHAAVLSWENRGEGETTARNVLAIEARAEDLVFFVNGEEVFRTSREGQHVDGVVGLRANHGLNIHVAKLDIQPIG